MDRGLSQAELADRLGLYADEIERYETGLQRIDARRLIDLAHALGAPVSAFWSGVRRDGD
jgi:transcriptional regulator with XRE-family HTH domain